MGSEFGVTAARGLNSLVWGKNCAMRIVAAPHTGRTDKYHQGNKVNKYEVVLYALPAVTDLETQKQKSVDEYVNVNDWMTKNGIARISATAKKNIRRKGGRKSSTGGSFISELLDTLEETQNAAHREHLRM